MKFSYIKSYFDKVLKKSLVKHTIWMLFSNVVSLVINAAYFVLIARSLGTEQYGAFVGITALIAILGPFASCGSGDLIIKNVSINRALFNQYWGNALLITGVSGFLLTVLVMLAAKIILPSTISLLLIFIFALSDLFFAKIISIASQAFIAVGQLKQTAQLTILLRLNRLMAALCLVFFFDTSKLLTWAFLYLVSTILSALVSFILIHRTLGSPKLALFKIKSEITEGFFFSVSLSSQNIYNDVDKTMLASISTFEATGIYGAAYRLINVAFVPIRSLLYAAYRKFFQEGSSGITGSFNFAKRLLPMALAYGIIAPAIVIVFAPFIPYILGDEYYSSIEALRWLAPLLFLKTIHYFAADTLTGAGFQKIRSLCQISVAVFNALANLWLIPLFSWKGAIWSSLASDGILMIALWSTVFILCKQKYQGTN